MRSEMGKSPNEECVRSSLKINANGASHSSSRTGRRAAWLKPKGMSQTALAEKMGLHVQVVNGRARMSSDLGGTRGARRRLKDLVERPSRRSSTRYGVADKVEEWQMTVAPPRPGGDRVTRP